MIKASAVALKLLTYFTWVLLAGCGAERSMILDLSSDAGFFDTGFPSDLKRSTDGSIDFGKFPFSNHPFVKDYRYAYSKT